MEAPKLNEIWQVQWNQGGRGIENNILVRIDENKKEFNPLNWRCNNFKCEHKGEQIIVNGNNFIEKWGKY